MKKYIAELLLSSSLFTCQTPVLAQQWALTNQDLTIQVVKNSLATFQVGKWLANFAVIGDSVSIIYQRNQDNSHFTLYLDKDSVTSPVVGSAAALYDTLEAWTIGTGGGGMAGVTSVSQAFGIIVTPNPITATGTIAIDSTQVATPYDLTSYVPYTGATGNVDLGTNNLYAQLVHVHDAIQMADQTHTDHVNLKFDEELTADRNLYLKINDASRTLTIAGDATISGTNTGDQTIANTSAATTHKVTLSASGGSVELTEGSNITLTTTGTPSDGIVTIASTAGGTDLSYSGVSSPVTLNSSTGTDVTITAGTGISLTGTATDLTIAGTVTQYTDELAQDAVGAMINTSLQYVDATPLLAINDRDFGDVDVSSSGTVWTIDTNAITNVKVNDVAIGKVTGLGTGVATWLATPSSANLASALTDETGTGLSVFNNSPSFVDDISIGTAATGTGIINLNGLTSGTVSITTQDIAGTWTLKLPADDGDANEVLTTDGSGNSTWEPVSATVITVANEAADATSFPVFVTAATGSLAPKSNASFTFDASIARLGSSSFVGAAFLSSAANTAATGVLRLANTGKVSWRNAANSTQYGMTLNASDIIEFDAGVVAVKSPTVFDAVTGYRINNAATTGTFLRADGTNYIASTSTIPTSAGATAGKWLKSDATNYVLSTSTLSDAPSTAGKILVSDGTNWITSTPTFPNASATSRKMTVSDGTNWVASTETWAVPGTSGNVLLSDGTNWTSSEKIDAMQFLAITGDQTSTSTSLADVSGLAAFSTVAGKTYYFSFELMVTTSATTVGILCTINHSTAITSINACTQYPITATTFTVERISALNGGTLPTAGPGATLQPYRISGNVVVNTAGTFALRFRSETGGAVVVKAGSHGYITRIN